jgi:2,3-bisphosphoglycerate-independent phosphoglycerate mutase
MMQDDPIRQQKNDRWRQLTQRGMDPNDAYDAVEKEFQASSFVNREPAPPRPVMLVILDGWGWREEVADNAVRQAKTPNFDALWASCPHAFLKTSGMDVGLPEGQMGNSEVGHLNIGAGRVVIQDLPRIDAAIADGSFARLPALTGLIAKLKASGGTCHLMGLLSPPVTNRNSETCVGR